MPKRRKKDEDLPVPPPRETQIFRLPPEVVRKLRIAADARGWNKTTYVLEAIRAQLKKDGIK